MDLSDEWIKKYPIDAGVFHMCAIAAHKLNQPIRKIKCMESYFGLISSIMGAVDGLSEQTAFKVISINEEYDVIKAYGGQLKKQFLIQDKHTVYDLMEIDVDGKLLKLYFDVSILYTKK